MAAHCCKCGNEVADAHVVACTVDADEAREFRELHIGDIVCTLCFHEIKWPSLTQSKDIEGMPDLNEEFDW